MSLDQVKELIEKGLTNAAIAEAVNLSIRQVQRLKRRLLETPVRLPKTTGALVKLLQKKAAQGDLVAIRTLLKEYKTTTDTEEKIPTFPWWFFWLSEEEQELGHALVTRAEQRQQRHPHKTHPTLGEIEALISAEEPPSPSAPPLSIETPTPQDNPPKGSTDAKDSQPPTSAVGDTLEGEETSPPEELPPSPLVNHTRKVNQRGGLRILKEK